MKLSLMTLLQEQFEFVAIGNNRDFTKFIWFSLKVPSLSPTIPKSSLVAIRVYVIVPMIRQTTAKIPTLMPSTTACLMINS